MVTTTTTTEKGAESRFKRWLLKGIKEREGPHESEGQHHQQSWWKVMCLTGVDYFSTLGYQPGIAFLAAGALSPIATLILVLLTLFGALPMYHRVAAESPHGDGSISMLEDLLSRWKGKLFVLCLLGFAATSFIITITLSAADATAHIIENPFVHDHLQFLNHRIIVTLVLISLLGAVFLKGFKEAVGIAVAIVIVYIALNLIVLGTGFVHIAQRPEVLTNWKSALLGSYNNPLAMIGAALFVFPKLALGLSGFETGVVVMPLVKGDKGDSHDNPVGRIRNTRKLLTYAALIMSVLLITSSIVTTMLIPAEAYRPETATQAAGEANGRALAFLAHDLLGDVFGTIYDISTISILWFAGSSAMAGLLNIVPRYLPRYGMAPAWAKATRPLVLVFTLICFLVTMLFRADVDAQGGAYATGVLALMTSAAIAVTLSVKRKGSNWWWAFLLISLVFVYTTIINIIEQPEGLKIASFFILAIVIASFISRLWRTTELRVEDVQLDEAAQRFIDEAGRGTIRIVANRC
ncbi:MAG: amino acid transporter, partial [Acidobacteriota bacterium]|nr:amino acid transporter [Acidobacteriota bacterium]